MLEFFDENIVIGLVSSFSSFLIGFLLRILVNKLSATLPSKKDGVEPLGFFLIKLAALISYALIGLGLLVAGILVVEYVQTLLFQ